jgi:hypothetical protein
MKQTLKILIFSLIIYLSSNSLYAGLSAKNGILDLRTNTVSSLGTVNLNGDWEFY